MSAEEDKVSLTRKRVELVESLATPLPPEERVRIQGEISVINAKLKALNTTAAAQLKAAADRRKAAGLSEAQANAMRARTKINGSMNAIDSDIENENDDPGQTSIIDGWIDAILLRYDIDFGRDGKGAVVLEGDPSRADAVERFIPQRLAATIELLVAGIYAAARGKELPELLPELAEGRPQLKAAKPRTVPKTKPKKR